MVCCPIRHEWVRLKTVQEWTDAYRRESRPGSDTQSALAAAQAFLLHASIVTNTDDGHSAPGLITLCVTGFTYVLTLVTSGARHGGAAGVGVP